MDDRARLSLPDVLVLLATFAFLGALYPVFREALETHAGDLSTGSVYIYQLVLPLVLLVILAVVYRKAVAGGP